MICDFLKERFRPLLFSFVRKKLEAWQGIDEIDNEQQLGKVAGLPKQQDKHPAV